MQASEKAYKVAEEVVKALVEVHGLEEYRRALREGRWYTYELSSASIKLSKTLGEWVLRVGRLATSCMYGGFMRLGMGGRRRRSWWG